MCDAGVLLDVLDMDVVVPIPVCENNNVISEMLGYCSPDSRKQ